MVINNSEIAVLKLFLIDPTRDYNIREISKITKVNYRLVYNAIKNLNKKEIIKINKRGNTNLCTIDLSKNHCLYAYIESLRRKDLEKKHKKIKVIFNELKKIEHVFYTAILFGSYVSGKQNKKSDIDLLFIIPNSLNTESFKKKVVSTIKLLSYPLDTNIITEDSFLEMKKKSELNVANEVIKNHIILVGVEQYFKLLTK